MRIYCLNTLLIYLLLEACLGNLTVFMPDDLANNFSDRRINYEIANFGYVPYGQRVMSSVHKPLLPTNITDPKLTLCQPVIKTHESLKNWALIAQRGNCSFVKKAHFAQLVGVNLLIVIDDRDEGVNEILAMDDYSGIQVHIPVVLISKRDGNVILEYMQNNPNGAIIIYVDFPKPNISDVVSIEYWMSSLNTNSYDFLLNFQQIKEKLFEVIHFVPHYALWYCIQCKIMDKFTEQTESCLSGGRYCEADPDGAGPLTGQTAVWEDLRQICILEYGEKEWWKYIQLFQLKCLDQVSTYSANKFDIMFEACSQDILEDLQIPIKEIQKCMTSSFTGNGDQYIDDNVKLQVEREKFMEEGIQMWPHLIVNNIGFQGDLSDPETSLEYICESFLNPPSPYCDKWNPESQNKINQQDNQSSGGVFWTYFFTISLLGIFMALIMFCFRRFFRRALNREVDFQVRESISQYYEMNESHKKDKTKLSI